MGKRNRNCEPSAAKFAVQLNAEPLEKLHSALLRQLGVAFLCFFFCSILCFLSAAAAVPLVCAFNHYLLAI